MKDIPYLTVSLCIRPQSDIQYPAKLGYPTDLVTAIFYITLHFFLFQEDSVVSSVLKEDLTPTNVQNPNVQDICSVDGLMVEEETATPVDTRDNVVDTEAPILDAQKSDNMCAAPVSVGENSGCAETASFQKQVRSSLQVL